MYKNIINKLKNKYIAILGFGMEGKSSYNFIRKYLKNEKIAILDAVEKKYDKFENDHNLELVFGNHYLDNLDKYDIIIKTPGASLVHLGTNSYKNKITSQMDLMLEYYKNQVIGITGTKGKSTTTTLIYQMLKEQGKDVRILGNIGKAVFDEIETFKEDTILVIEMSAHQLEYSKVSPHIGIILNLYQDHLDHAGSVKHYHENKMNIFKYQTNDDIGIYASDNKYLNKYVNDNNYQAKLYSVSLNNDSDIYIKNNYVCFKDKKLYDINQERTLKGDYNLENIMFVLFISELLHLDLNKTIEIINNFQTLPHRLELVGTFNKVTYYDDAISTIPEATINAIKTLKQVDTLIFGGLDRKVDNSDLVNYLNNSNVTNIICMPKTGHDIGKKITKDNVYFVDTLTEAVALAKQVTQKNKICLMSPGAASYEYYKNYIEKGNEYQKLVKNA